MKKTTLLKRTAVSLFISSAILGATVSAASSTAILDFSSLDNFSQPIDLTQQFSDKGVFGLGSGTLTFRVKPDGGFSNLLGVSDPTSNVRYAAFYVNTRNGVQQFGIELRDSDRTRLIPNTELVTPPLPVTNDFRTVTYSFDKENQTIKIYVDGELKKTTHQSKFFEDMPYLTTATLGSLKRASYPANNFSGSIYHAGATDDVLSDDAIIKLHQDIAARQTKDLAVQAEKLAFLANKKAALGAFMSEKYEMFKPGQHGAASYRIPGLLTTKDGVTIAEIDKRNQHYKDWGNIDLVIRRSVDGGKTWLDDQVVIDLPSQTYAHLGEAESALVIDGVMTQDKQTGRIFMVFDMFPESQALFGMFNNSQTSFESEGSGHVKVGDKWYRLLTDANGERYTVREDGIVYDRLGEAMDFKVITEGDPARSFQDLGDIIQISSNERVGNIFLRSQKPGNDSGPFNAHYTSYLWLTYSDNNGESWASPIDITSQVKADWMRFLGTGPGTGIQLKNGNLMIPVYFTNRDNKQSAAVIISEDGGKTWKRGESPNDAYLNEIGGSRYLNSNDYEITESQVVEMNNGDIKMFSRNRSGAVIISTSHDGGMTWDKGARLREAALLDPYSQMSAIHYSKLIDGKEYLVFANPHAGSRRNGKAWLGEVQPDGSIEWKFNTIIDEGTYSYNSLSELPNGDIGLLYEQRQGENVQFVRFNLQELFWKHNFIYRDNRNTDNPTVSLNSLEDETYYKIGDGEMVKVGEGINPARLDVREGIATLSQTANANGEKQAYSAVTVKENGTLRLLDENQVNLSRITLEKGTLDLHGRDFTLSPQDNAEPTGLRSPIVDGNIVNHADTAATLQYRLNGNHQISGRVGDNTGVLNLQYQPDNTDSALMLDGTSQLNDVNVQHGKLIYANNPHQAKTIRLAEQGKLQLQGNAALTAETLTLDADTLLSLNGDNNQLTTNVNGDGNIEKSGSGYAKINGELTHSGTTQLNGGEVELNGNITQSAVSISGNSVLSGQGMLGSRLTLAEGSIVSPHRFVINPDTFNGRQFVINDLHNQGGRFVLTVNNDSENMENWQHDQILIKGTLDTDKDIPVDIQLLNTMTGNSDSDHDGQYDADEGLSLIQVKGANALQRLKLGQTLSLERSGNLYPLTLVSVEAGATLATENRLGTADTDFTDFRLQNVMIDENGQPLEPVVRLAPPPSETPVEPTPPATAQPETPVEPTPPAAVEPETPVEPTPPAAAQPETPVEPTPPAVVQPETPVEPAPPAAAQPETPVQPTPPAAEPEMPIQSAPSDKASRPAIAARVPSYLVSGMALYQQGHLVQQIFLNNIWSEHKKGLYAVQSYSHSTYHSDRSFADYGYDYKAKQHTSVLGGYVSINPHTELHSAVAFSKQTVEPKAADGYSQGKYKTVSGLLALNNRWDNLLLNVGVGYHRHRGDISTAELKRAAKVKARQMQVFGQIGYEIPFGNVSLTPMLGLSYQHVRSDINDHMQNWTVNVDNQRVFSQQIGSYFSWKGDMLNLHAGVFYEHHHSNHPTVRIAPTANQHEVFAVGGLGNTMLYKAVADVKLAPSLTFSLQFGHRQGVSEAKLKQSHILSKLEYRF